MSETYIFHSTESWFKVRKTVQRCDCGQERRVRVRIMASSAACIFCKIIKGTRSISVSSSLPWGSATDRSLLLRQVTSLR